MYFLVLLFAMLGVPLALAVSLFAGISVAKQRAGLGGAIIVTSLLGVLAALWQMRFDLDFMRAIFSSDARQLDFQEYSVALYAALFAMLLFARLRWNTEDGKGILLIAALLLWLLAAAPYMILSPGDFAH